MTQLIRWSAGRRVVTAIGLVLAVARMSGAEPLPLDRALALARESNPSLRASAAEAEAAAFARREAGAARWPAVTVRQSALRTDSPADAFGLQLNQERFSFPAFTAGNPNDPAPLINYATEIGVSYPLFTGGRLRAGIRQADDMARAARASSDHAARRLSLDVAAAYTGVLLADRLVLLADLALRTTGRHRDETRSFYDAGMIVESDMLQVEVQQARMEEARIEATRAAAMARVELNRVLGVDYARRFELSDSIAAERPAVVSLDSARARARRERDDLAAASAATGAARAGVTGARSGFLPEIGLLARYAWSDDRLFGRHGSSGSIGASARWDLWDGGRTRAVVSRRRSELRAASEKHRAAEQAIDAEIQDTWLAMDAARARRRTAETARVAAERALAILEDRYSQGIARTTDLLDAETLAHETRVTELRARFDQDQSIRRFNFATGSEPVTEASSR